MEPLCAATSPALMGTSGKYFARERETASSRESYDEAVGARLWDICARAVGPVP